LLELLKEKGNALKLARKADLIIDGAGGIWTQCNDLKASMSDLRRLAYTTVVGAGFSIDSQFHCFHAFFLIGNVLRKSDSSSLVWLGGSGT
jgi:hypothetical protein